MPVSQELDEKAEDGKHKVSFASPKSGDVVFNRANKKNFDNLPGHLKHFIDRLITHGDLAQAAEESGVRNKHKKIDFSQGKKLDMKHSLLTAGINPYYVSDKLKECLDAKYIKMDKHGNPAPDYKTQLRALELILKLRGDFDGQKENKIEDKNILELIEIKE